MDQQKEKKSNKDNKKNKEREIAVKVNNVSKTFRIPHKKIDSMRSVFVNSLQKNTYEEFNALDDISFDVAKGEFLGIIGHNGAGKSTLLKILAGVYNPSSGSIEINGMIAPFLELGIGFNPELSGRDNVYLNATVLGLTKKQIDEKFDDIVEFSELEKFIDQQLKNYSSGMKARLAFSVSIHANREILLMDEVLAVGDSAFQEKCLDIFKSYKKAGRTVILVTHSMTTVREYCDRALLLSKGKLLEVGDVDDVCDEYVLNSMAEADKKVIKNGNLSLKIEKNNQLEIKKRELKEISGKLEIKSSNFQQKIYELQKKNYQFKKELNSIKSSKFWKLINLYFFIKVSAKEIKNRIIFKIEDMFKSNHDFPIFIISFNRKEHLKSIINSYGKLNRKVEIIIHDNGSDDVEVLKYLKKLESEGVMVFYESKINSPEEINNISRTADAYFKTKKASNYIVTDPDIELINVNKDLLDLYEHLLTNYPETTCVGPMLTIRDIPDDYILKNHVFDLHIKQFWGNKPEEITWKGKSVAIQFCPIDTTFAMYRKNFIFKRLNEGIRVYCPYEAHHLDWYICNKDKNKKEYSEYSRKASSNVAHWNSKDYIDKFSKKEREKRKIYYVESDKDNNIIIKSEMI